MQDKSLLSAAEVAARFHVSVSTLRRRVRDRRFPAGTKHGTNATRWPAEVVDKWVADRTPKGAVPPWAMRGVPRF